MNTRQKNITVKVLAGTAAVVTGAALGMSGVEAALHAVDFGFIKAGKEPVKCFMLKPDAKIFKGYRIYDPVTGVTRKVSKKKFFEVMSQIPETKRYVKIAAGAIVGILTLAGITKVLYSEYTKKIKCSDTEQGRMMQQMAFNTLGQPGKKKNKKKVTSVNDDSEDEFDPEDLI